MAFTVIDPSLSEYYDTAVLDLDGVVYIGSHPVAGAPDALRDARTAGIRVAFVTNNAARTPTDVARHLCELGVPAEPSDVVTSAQAAARLVAGEVEPGSAVFVIGGAGLAEALRELGLAPVTALDGPDPVAVVQGFSPDIPWRQVIDGAILVRDGLPWVATNTDLTVPTERGPGPGNGALVELVARFAGRTPRVAGKPQPALFTETLTRVCGSRPLVVGDRIDTDIAGAIAVGWDSLLVMTGVTTLADIAALSADLRPTYVGADLSRLDRPVELDHGWSATVGDGRLRVTGSGDLNGWWAAVAPALWGNLDQVGLPASVDGIAPGSVGP